jgi:diguanylate cyclase
MYASSRARLVIDQCLAIVSTRALESLSSDATRDELTGLFNRRAWNRELRGCFNDAQRDGSWFSIVNIDLDGLKIVNDSEGHEAGDALIKRMGVALYESVAPPATVYRWGGDEFAMLVPDAEAAAVATVIEVIESVAPRFSYGIACYPDDSDNLTDLQRCADERMYEVKQAHKLEGASGDSEPVDIGPS